MKLHNTNHGIKLFVTAENRTRDLSDHSRDDLPLSHEASESCNDMNNAGAKTIVISLSVELSRIRDKGDYVLIIWNFNED